MEASGAGEFRLVVHDDDSHSFPYVIAALVEVMGIREGEAQERAYEVHESGRTTFVLPDLPAAERARERLYARGRDPLLPRSRASLVVGVERVVDGATTVVSLGRHGQAGLETLTLDDLARIQAEATREMTELSDAGTDPGGAGTIPSIRGVLAVIACVILFFIVCGVVVRLGR